MADDATTDGAVDERTETSALQDALAAEHAAVWGYGVVGAALGPAGRSTAAGAESAHRDVRDRLLALLEQRKADPVPAKAGYELPFPVLSGADAAKLAVVLEDGVAAAWVRVLDRAAVKPARQLAVEVLGSTEARAVAWRRLAGQTPVTTPFPGLPD
jgi:Domain of unknown function (DUF4439)